MRANYNNALAHSNHGGKIRGAPKRNAPHVLVIGVSMRSRISHARHRRNRLSALIARLHLRHVCRRDSSRRIARFISRTQRSSRSLRAMASRSTRCTRYAPRLAAYVCCGTGAPRSCFNASLTSRVGVFWHRQHALVANRASAPFVRHFKYE